MSTKKGKEDFCTALESRATRPETDQDLTILLHWNFYRTVVNVRVDYIVEQACRRQRRKMLGKNYVNTTLDIEGGRSTSAFMLGV
jgi:hypothetical protein